MKYVAREAQDKPEDWEVVSDQLDIIPGALIIRTVFFGFDAKGRAETYAAWKNENETGPHETGPTLGAPASGVLTTCTGLPKKGTR